MQNKIINKFFLEKIFLIGSFLYLVSAINNPFVNINFSSISSSITTFRGIAPYIMMPILIVYLLFINRNLKLEWIYFLFLIYLFGQFAGYLINPLGYTYHLNDQNQVYWLICNFTVILYFYTIRDNRDLNILILKLFIFIVSILAIKFLIDVYIEFFEEFLKTNTITNFFYNIHSMSPNRLFLEQPVPRSSGLSRMVIIIFLFFYIQFFFAKNNKYKTILYLILLGFLTFSILNLQNRITVFYMVLLTLFTLFFKISNVTFKSKIVFVLSIFILPFFIHLNLEKITFATVNIYKFATENQNIVNKNIKTDKGHNLKNIDKVDKIDKIDKIDKVDKIDRINKNEKSEILKNLKTQRIFLKSSTGRKELWSEAISHVVENDLKGYGPQADRTLLDQNISSLYFYSILCGGIIYLIAIILISTILFFKSMKMIFIKNIFTSTQKFTCFSLLIIGYFYLRTIVEISFGVFGIDMIMFFITFNIFRNSENY